MTARTHTGYTIPELFRCFAFRDSIHLHHFAADFVFFFLANFSLSISALPLQNFARYP